MPRDSVEVAAGRLLRTIDYGEQRRQFNNL
jgi:hypothetical protein